LGTVDGVLHKGIVNESNVEAIIKKIKIGCGACVDYDR
jgi:hypothetical protein